MKYPYKVLTLLFLSSNSIFATHKDELKKIEFFGDHVPNELIVSFSSFLTGKEVAQLSKVNRKNSKILSKGSLAGGQKLREDSKFGVIECDGTCSFLPEYLSQTRNLKISSVNNITQLVEKKPNDFMRLVLKSIPHSEEIILKDLEAYCKNILLADDLVTTLPIYETSQQNLVDLLVDFVSWGQIWDQVWDLIWEVIWSQISKDGTEDDYDFDEIETQVRDHIYAQFGNDTREQLWGQFREKIQVQVWSKVWIHSKRLIIDKVKHRVLAKLSDDLSQFRFDQAYTNGTLKKTLKPAADYAFLTFALGVISIRHSENFKSNYMVSNRDLSFIDEHISESRALDILENFEIIQDPSDNYLVSLQLKFLNRHLPKNNQR